MQTSLSAVLITTPLFTPQMLRQPDVELLAAVGVPAL